LRTNECVLEELLVAVRRHICPYPAQRDCSNETETKFRPFSVSRAEATSSGDRGGGIGSFRNAQNRTAMTETEMRVASCRRAFSDRRRRGSMQHEASAPKERS
jgi:hypothetical protein